MEPKGLVADAMLGSLARKLRIFGFDALYYREGPDAGLLELALSEGRVILTSDRPLAALAQRRGVAAILIEGTTDAERMRSLREGARASSTRLEAGPSRCASCNIVLVGVKASEARAELPSRVASRHRVYYRCPGCQKLYWKGGQWRRLRPLSNILPQRQRF